MDLTNFKNYLKININSSDSQKSYISRMREFFRFYNEFNQENINAYLAQKLDKGNGEQWFNQTMTAMRHYEKSVGVNFVYPKFKKIPKNERDFLTKDELEKEILPYFKHIFPKQEKFYIFIVKFLFYTGVRTKEFWQLKPEDILWDEKIFICRKSKNGTDKKIPFPSFLIPDMKKYLLPENKVTKSIITNIFRTLKKELRYKKNLHPHLLRHSYSHYMLELGIPIERLQILLGHSNIKTTMIYAKPRVEDALKSYHERFNSEK